MRIVAGTLKGRPILAPEHEGLRPTSDRVREAVFNIIAHGMADVDIAGARVLDLFAGTGALGIEAMSRGATYCLFVENDADARGLIRRNVEALGLVGVTRIFRRDATDMGPAGRNDGFALVLCDPPYGQGFGELALDSVARGGWLLPGALAVIEERVDAKVTLPQGFTRIDCRTWGQTQVTFARFS